MCVLNVHVCGCSWVGEVGDGSPGAGVADICELCCMDSGNPTWVL